MSQRQGFTLIEMSIVLVIIGLIVGGVLAGKELVDNAKVLKLRSAVENAVAATRSFEGKYDALPGDMANANVIWPSCDSPATNCNGNGNQKIDLTESARAWQQLSDAGMVPGSYDGQGLSGIGTQVPKAPYSQSGLVIAWDNAVYNTGHFIGVGDTSSTVLFAFGTPAITQTVHMNASFDPALAFRLDSKFDDGIPFKGKVIGERPLSSFSCYNISSPAGETYQTAISGKHCFLKFYSF